MRRLIFLTILCTFSVLAFGQNERKHIRSGNKIYMDAVKDSTKIDTVKFADAETEYRKALNKKPNDLKWNFNLADAIYKQGRFDEAAGKFGELGEKMETPVEKARAYHNMGNSQLMNSKVDESIESYKKALRQNPTDLETKYNLAYAQLLKKMQQQQQQQNQDQNKDKDKEDQDKQDQNKDNQNQNKDQQNKDQQDQQNKQDQKQQQQQQNKISKENAEQLLQALQNDERNIQDKVKKQKAALAKRAKTEKEW